jgi:DNA-directed RNA polymerase subunit M/transcription elongation factor TFIIS
MEFCPKCGSRLEPKKSKNSKEATIVLVCPKDGYKKESGEKVEPPKIGKVIQHNPQQLVAVIGKNNRNTNAPHSKNRMSQMREQYRLRLASPNSRRR